MRKRKYMSAPTKCRGHDDRCNDRKLSPLGSRKTPHHPVRDSLHAFFIIRKVYDEAASCRHTAESAMPARSSFIEFERPPKFDMKRQTNPISLNSFCILPLFLIFIKKLQIYYTQKTFSFTGRSDPYFFVLLVKTILLFLNFCHQ